jgi:hypothetical protein
MMRAGHIYFGGSTVNQDFSRPSTKLSITRQHTEGTPLPCAASVAYKGSGELENTFHSADRFYSANSTPDESRVEFTPWRLSQSQFTYRGTPNAYDLGEL